MQHTCNSTICPNLTSRRGKGLKKKKKKKAKPHKDKENRREGSRLETAILLWKMESDLIDRTEQKPKSAVLWPGRGRGMERAGRCSSKDFLCAKL